MSAYFFSSSSVDPVSNGTFEHPFHSLAEMPQPISGDAFYFKAGDTFSGPLRKFSACSGVTISSYGRSTAHKRAIIRSGENTAVELENCSNVAITYLKFVGLNQTSNALDGIRFHNTANGRTSRIVVDHCVVHNYGGAGIAFRANKTKPSGKHPNPFTTGFDFVTVSDCSVSGGALTADFGILVGDGGIDQPFDETGTPIAGGNYSHKHVIIDGCIVSNIRGFPHDDGTSAAAGSGTLIAEAQSVLVQNCQAYNNGDANTAASGPFGIWFISVANGVIQNCISHDNIKTLTPSPDIPPVDGGGFDLDNNCVFCTMQYNYSYNNGGAGYYIFDAYNDSNIDGPDWNANNVVRYNISENDARNNEAGIMVGSRVKNAQIYNNTVYITPSDLDTENKLPAAFWVRGKRYSGLDVHNNIFFSDGVNQRSMRVENPGIDAAASALPYITLDFNDYFNPQAPGQKSISYLDLNTSTKVHPLKDLQRSLNGAQELHGTVLDPQFVGGMGKEKFELTSESLLAGVGAL